VCRPPTNHRRRFGIVATAARIARTSARAASNPRDVSPTKSARRRFSWSGLAELTCELRGRRDGIVDLNEGRSAPEKVTRNVCNLTRCGLVPVYAVTNTDPLQNPYSMFRFPVSPKKFPVPLHWEFCR